jgi:hypothetical protein
VCHMRYQQCGVHHIDGVLKPSSRTTEQVHRNLIAPGSGNTDLGPLRPVLVASGTRKSADPSMPETLHMHPAPA